MSSACYEDWRREETQIPPARTVTAICQQTTVDDAQSASSERMLFLHPPPPGCCATLRLQFNHLALRRSSVKFGAWRYPVYSCAHGHGLGSAASNAVFYAVSAKDRPALTATVPLFRLAGDGLEGVRFLCPNRSRRPSAKGESDADVSLGPDARFDRYLALRIGRFLSSEEEPVRLSREISIPPRRTLKAVSVHRFASAHCQTQGFTDSSVVPDGALLKRAGALLFRDGKGLVSDP
jgi:hypothetical protein